MPQAASSVPVFQLYGEQKGWPTPDFIHCESIAERSRLHHWEIKPHRHSGLTQLLYLRAGQGITELDGVSYELRPPVILLVPEMCIHGFEFSRDVEGQVITLASPLVRKWVAKQETLQPFLATPALYPVGDNDQLEPLISAITEEYRRPAPGREYVVESLVGTLLIWLSRRRTQARAAGEHLTDRSNEHLTRFTQVVERGYREHRPLDFYADHLGVTAAHLNTLCRRLSGRSALQIIHERLLLEAKRNLVYTTMNISQISDSLGFSEPAYFTRFFKRHTGVSPKTFRQHYL